MHRLGFGVAGVLLATACSSGPAFETRDDLAEAIGCDGGVTPTQQGELYLEEAGTCLIGGSEVQMFTFGDDGAQEQWLELALSFGGLYLVGDGWSVEGERATLEAVQADVGGEIQ